MPCSPSSFYLIKKMQARDIGKHLSAKSIGEDGRKKLLNILFFEAMGQLEYTGLESWLNGYG
jgi:hypothetical protein